MLRVARVVQLTQRYPQLIQALCWDKRNAPMFHWGISRQHHPVNCNGHLFMVAIFIVQPLADVVIGCDLEILSMVMKQVQLSKTMFPTLANSYLGNIVQAEAGTLRNDSQIKSRVVLFSLSTFPSWSESVSCSLFSMMPCQLCWSAAAPRNLDWLVTCQENLSHARRETRLYWSLFDVHQTNE